MNHHYIDSEELLDFLLTHHAEDEVAERQKNEESIALEWSTNNRIGMYIILKLKQD